jgi:hypothetical protein
MHPQVSRSPAGANRRRIRRPIAYFLDFSHQKTISPESQSDGIH